jgi:hypothetical protein
VRGPVDTVGSVAEFLSNNIPNTRAPDHTLYLSYSRVMGVPYTSSAEPLEGEEPTILPARMEFVWRPLRRKVARAATPAQPPPRVRTFAIGEEEDFNMDEWQYEDGANHAVEMLDGTIRRHVTAANAIHDSMLSQYPETYGGYFISVLDILDELDIVGKTNDPPTMQHSTAAQGALVLADWATEEGEKFVLVTVERVPYRKSRYQDVERPPRQLFKDTRRTAGTGPLLFVKYKETGVSDIETTKWQPLKRKRKAVDQTIGDGTASTRSPKSPTTGATSGSSPGSYRPVGNTAADVTTPAISPSNSPPAGSMNNNASNNSTLSSSPARVSPIAQARIDAAISAVRQAMQANASGGTANNGAALIAAPSPSRPPHRSPSPFLTRCRAHLFRGRDWSIPAGNLLTRRVGLFTYLISHSRAHESVWRYRSATVFVAPIPQLDICRVGVVRSSPHLRCCSTSQRTFACR